MDETYRIAQTAKASYSYEIWTGEELAASYAEKKGYGAFTCSAAGLPGELRVVRKKFYSRTATMQTVEGMPVCEGVSSGFLASKYTIKLGAGSWLLQAGTLQVTDGTHRRGMEILEAGTRVGFGHADPHAGNQSLGARMVSVNQSGWVQFAESMPIEVRLFCVWVMVQDWVTSGK